MPHPFAGKTVEEILEDKKASIRTPPLDPGSPSWDDILYLTWEEIDKRSRRRDIGFQTFRKLLTDRRFNK
jgi:hypothetical protein